MSKNFFAAIEAGDLDAVARLLADGADPNQLSTGRNIWSPLDCAIYLVKEGGPLEMMVLLLRSGARADVWNEDRDMTPLLMAVLAGKRESVELLLAMGADPNVRNSEGTSPLRWCAEESNLEMAALLLRCGATATINEAGGGRAMTALGQAAWLLDLPMIELLLKFGADPDTRDNDDMTAFDRLPGRDGSDDELVTKAEALLQRPPLRVP